MEGRFSNILLIMLTSITLHSTSALSAVPTHDADAFKPIIEPDIKRTVFDESKIESTDFEIIGTVGILSVEDFGANAVAAIKLGYHVTDNFFIGAEIAKSRAGKTSFETLSGSPPILADDELDITYYLLTVGYNILPGEAFVSNNITYNTSFYVTGGLGSTQFAGDTRFTTSLGVGYRVLISNYLSIYTDMSSNFFNLDVLGEDKNTINLQFTVGLGYYF